MLKSCNGAVISKLGCRRPRIVSCSYRCIQSLAKTSVECIQLRRFRYQGLATYLRAVLCGLLMRDMNHETKESSANVRVEPVWPNSPLIRLLPVQFKQNINYKND